MSEQAQQLFKPPTLSNIPDTEKGARCSRHHRWMARADLPGNINAESRRILSLISKRGIGVVTRGPQAVDFLSLAGVGTL